MKSLDHQYIAVLKDLIDKSESNPEVRDRTGVGTFKSFGNIITVDISNSFPMLLSKQVPIKSMIAEFLFFLNGYTNNEWLIERGCKFWDEFKHPETGELGPVYGAQLRNFNNQGCDQLANLIEGLKTRPNSRRHMFTYFNPLVMPDETKSHKQNIEEGRAVLPPCHLFYQFNVENEYLDGLLYQREQTAPFGSNSNRKRTLKSGNPILGQSIAKGFYMKLFYVYKILCKNSQKFYIGSSYNPYKRFMDHFRKCKNLMHSSPLLQDETNKGEIISLEILDSFDSELEAKNMELSYINRYWDSGLLLNDRRISTGGDNISTHDNKDEIVAKINKMAKKSNPKYGAENPNYKEGKYSKSNAFCNNCGSPVYIGSKYCKKCSLKNRRNYDSSNNPFYGKTHSDKTKELIRSKLKGMPNLKCSKKISVDGAVFNSVSEASKMLNISSAVLSYRARKNIFNTFYIETHA